MKKQLGLLTLALLLLVPDFSFGNIKTPAKDISTDVTQFGPLIPATSTDVQKALNTLSNLDIQVVNGWTRNANQGYVYVANSADNVGIGTNVPSSKLQVVGSISASGTLGGSNFSGSSSGTNTGDVGIGTANGLSVSTTGQLISLRTADTSNSGALSSTDWNTFNGKQAAGNYITALTSDVTATGPGSAAATLSSTYKGWTLTSSIINTAGSYNVGIGSAAPGQKLDVQGTIRASSDMVIGTQSVCQANGTNCPGSFTGFANPSVSIGTTVVNGSATTALRSDGASAIDQAMVPVWTQLHKFNKSPISLVTAANVGVGSVNPTTALDVTGTAKATSLQATGLTSGRVPYLTTSGLLTDSANMVFSGNNLSVGTTFASASINVHSNGLLVLDVDGQSSGTSVANNSIMLVTNSAIVTGGYAGIGFDNGIGNGPHAAMGARQAGSNAWDLFFANANGSTMVENMRLQADGNLGVGTTLPSTLFEVGARKFNVLSGGNVGIGTIAPAGALVVMNGNVGIGSITPSRPLVVLGNVGFGTTGAPNINVKVNGSVTADHLFQAGNVGLGTTTIGIDNGPIQNVGITTTLGSYLTIAAPAAGVGKTTVELTQDSTGSKVVQFWTNCKWPSGTAPTLTTTANAIDIVSIFYDGTRFNCQESGDFR